MFRYQGSGTAHYIFDDIRDDVKRTYVEEIVKLCCLQYTILLPAIPCILYL
jgi:hypothetical protein